MRLSFLGDYIATNLPLSLFPSFSLSNHCYNCQCVIAIVMSLCYRKISFNPGNNTARMTIVGRMSSWCILDRRGSTLEIPNQGSSREMHWVTGVTKGYCAEIPGWDARRDEGSDARLSLLHRAAAVNWLTSPWGHWPLTPAPARTLVAPRYI